jgi:hypothetical protein
MMVESDLRLALKEKVVLENQDGEDKQVTNIMPPELAVGKGSARV